MLVAAAIMALACVLPLVSPDRLPEIPLPVLVGMVVVGAGSLTLALYCAWFAFGPAARFRLTEESLRYRGLFGAVRIPWDEFETARLHYGGRSPFVYLLVRRRGARRVTKMNASGISPTHEVLFDWVKQRAPHAVRRPVALGLAEAAGDALGDD